MSRVPQVVLVVTGVVHLLPAVGVSGSQRLRQLYGVEIDDPDTALLLRHRAVLFTILGVILVTGAFDPRLHGPVSLIALASIASFVALHAVAESTTPELARVAAIDAALIPLLLVSAVIAYGPWF